MDAFDFEYWRELFESNPEEFEKRRKQVTDELIVSCNKQRRLKGLQFKVDMERKRSRNSIGSCVRLSTIMLDHFHSEFVASINRYAPYRE